MLPNFLQRTLAKPCQLLMCAALAVALSACGGGGGSPGTVPGHTTPTDPGSPGTTTPVVEASIAVTIVDAAGAKVTTLSGVQTATVKAVVKDATGALVPNAIVKFTVDTSLIAFTPVSGSALTDATGTASVTIKPIDATGGAVAITAASAVGTKAVTATTNLAIGPGVVVFEPTIAMTIVDNAGATVSTISGVQSANVRALVKDATGAVAPNAIVTFSTTDSSLVTFIPGSGSALSDATGMATITVKPTSVLASGAAGITASAVVAGKTAIISGNLSIGAAPLVVSALSFLPAPVGPLPAFNSAALNVQITSGGAPATVSTGIVVSSTCMTDGTASVVLGPMGNGVQPATYTNNGCIRGTDTITVSIGNSSKTITLAVDAASIGTIQFVGSDLSGKSIVLKGSGGLGRRESALLTFKVLDQNNTGLPGVRVDFTASTNTGGLGLAPLFGTTDATGQVSTTVSSGTIPTPVRVFAQASRNGKTISGLSDTLIVSTGLPIQKAMSLSVDSYNIEGLSIDGVKANVTVRMADQYGNPISDDTAVNFITEGGAIGSSHLGGCTTVNGGCSVELSSQNFRPLNGRVTILAYVQGLEDFTDLNGDGQYSCTSFTAPDGNVGPYRPLIDTCAAGAGEPFVDMGDPFLDTGILGPISFPHPGSTFDGSYDPLNGDLPIPFIHPVFSATGDHKWGLNYIRASTEITFSGSVPTFVRQVCNGATCRDWVPTVPAVPASPGVPAVPAVPNDGIVNQVAGLHGVGCTAQTISFRVYDVNNNPLPHKTTIGGGDADKVGPGQASPNIVGSTTAIGGTIHSMTIKPDKDCLPGSFSVVLGLPSLVSYAYGFVSAP